MAVLTKITSRTLADNSVTSAKIQAGAVVAADVGTNAITAVELADDAVDAGAIADGAVTDAKLSAGTTEGDSFSLPGQHVKIPSVTTTQRNALTAAVGMLIYNSTLGIMQQYNATGWQSIDTPPSVTSLDYPGSTTALNTVGGDTLIVNGSNFKAGLTVTINGTVPGSITINSSTQLTLGNTPAKAAQTYVNGLVITNSTGLSAQVNVDYSALPAWTTSSGNVGSFFNSTTIAEVDLAATAATSYAVTSGALPGGLSMATSDGDITGTISGAAATYNFTVTATDAESQTAARAFNIINKGALPTGGTVTTYGAYRVHTFTSLGNTNFVSGGAVAIDYIIVAGGGAGGSWHAGGGGAGGVRLGTGLVLTAQTYTITVGDGGAGAASGTPASGGNSAMSGTGGFTTITATGGGAGGRYGNIAPSDGGSGAGGNGDNTNNVHLAGDGINDGGTFGTATYQGHDGGNGVPNHAGGGGGGAGTVGEAANNSNTAGDGGNGINAFWGMSVADTTLLLNSASIGEVDSQNRGGAGTSTRWVAGGGGGGVWANASPGLGGLGTKNHPRAQGSYNGNSTAPIAVVDSMGAGGSGSGSQGGTTSYQTQTTGGSGFVIIRYLAV